jgi:hypothetical protein
MKEVLCFVVWFGITRCRLLSLPLSLVLAHLLQLQQQVVSGLAAPRSGVGVGKGFQRVGCYNSAHFIAAGARPMARAGIDAGLRCRGYDLRYGERYNCLTPSGLRHWMTAVLHLIIGPMNE